MSSYGRFQDFPLRPLNKGMFRDLPPNGIPEGGFFDLKNMRVKEGYMEPRGGLFSYFDGSIDLSADDIINYDFSNLREKIQDVIFNWKTTQQSESLVVTDNFLYEIENRTKATHILYTTDNVTYTGNSVDGNILTLTGVSAPSNKCRVTDYIRLNGATDVIGQISSIITDEWHINLDPSVTWLGTDNIDVLHVFQVRSGYKVDSTILGGYGTTESGNVLILTDQSERGVYQYTNGTLSTYETDSSPLADEIEAHQTLGSAKACTFFDDRLWLGNITETAGANYPQRIWWSDALNFKRFNPTNYFDLPYSPGELLALKPLGNLLIAYFTDTIYLGRPTQILGRPYEFQPFNTDDIGLVSQGALTTHEDGHFFVGQDDIYYLSGSAALQRIGNPIKSLTVQKTTELQQLEYVQVANDPSTESVAFLFPNVEDDTTYANGLSTRIWRFYKRTKAWDYDEVPIINGQPQAYFSSISLARVVTKDQTYQDWYDLDGAVGDPKIQTNDYTTEWLGSNELHADYAYDPSIPDGTPPNDQQHWADLGSYDDLNNFTISAPRLFMGVYYLDTAGYYIQNIVYEARDNYLDRLGQVDYPIECSFISADLDFGAPDRDKFTRGFSIRILESVDEPFLPSVWVSDGKSRISPVTGLQEVWWQATSPIRYFTHYNEGKTGFLARGSTFRFKVSFDRQPEVYKISEIIIHSKIEGEQVDL